MVLPESRSLVLRFVQVFWLHTAGLRNKNDNGTTDSRVLQSFYWLVVFGEIDLRMPISLKSAR